MGKVLLIVIAAGIVWTGSVIWGWFEAQEVPPSAPGEASVESPVSERPRAIPQQDQANQSASVSDGDESVGVWVPWPVFAHSDDWVYIEGWGFAKVGEELPTGEVLEGWTENSLIVRGENGKKYQRIRRVQEALKTLVHQVGMVTPGGGDK